MNNLESNQRQLITSRNQTKGSIYIQIKLRARNIPKYIRSKSKTLVYLY